MCGSKFIYRMNNILFVKIFILDLNCINKVVVFVINVNITDFFRRRTALIYLMSLNSIIFTEVHLFKLSYDQRTNLTFK